MTVTSQEAPKSILVMQDPQSILETVLVHVQWTELRNSLPCLILFAHFRAIFYNTKEIDVFLFCCVNTEVDVCNFRIFLLNSFYFQNTMNTFTQQYTLFYFSMIWKRMFLCKKSIYTLLCFSDCILQAVVMIYWLFITLNKTFIMLTYLLGL